MWSTIGSLRESAERRLSTVRENALAAGQVVSEVLTAAATEDDVAPSSPPNTTEAGWQQWTEDPRSQHSSAKANGHMSSRPATDQKWNNSPAPPVPSSAPPPPPSPGSDAPSFQRASSKRRTPRARYVVTGKETATAPPAPYLAPPRPSYVNFEGARNEPKEKETPSSNPGQYPAPLRPPHAHIGGIENSPADNDAQNDRALPNSSEANMNSDVDHGTEVPTEEQGFPVNNYLDVPNKDETGPMGDELMQICSDAADNVPNESRAPEPEASDSAAGKDEPPVDGVGDWSGVHQESTFGTEEWPAFGAVPKQDEFEANDAMNAGPGLVSGENGKDESFFNMLSHQPASVPLQTSETRFLGTVDEHGLGSNLAPDSPRKQAEESISQEIESEISAAPAADILRAPTSTVPCFQSSATNAPEHEESHWQPELKQQRDEALLQISDLKKEVNRLQSAQSSKAEVVAEQEFAIQNLREDMQVVSLERDTAIASKELVSRELENLKREVLELRDEVADCKDDTHRAIAERDEAKRNVQNMQEAIEQITLERDAAVESGHNGLREARSALESTDSRRSALLEEVESLRSRLERVGLEKNEAQLQAEQLRLRHQMESEAADARVTESERRLREVTEKVTSLETERDDAMTTSSELLSEQRQLLSETQARAGQLTEKENELRELEKALRLSSTERDIETARLEALAAQLAEMKETMEASILERNNLHEERNALSEELQKALADVSLATASAAESKRQFDSISKQSQESESRIKLLQAEVQELRKKCDGVVQERDALIRGRTAAIADSSNLPESMKALTLECESKTNEISLLQQQVKSATVKISKLTAQRNTILRQRDDAGARLTAAGSEFSSMNAKLKRLSVSNVDALNTVQKLQVERDELRSKIADLVADAAKVEALEKALADCRSQAGELEAELSNVKQSLLGAEETRLGIQSELQLTKAELKRLGEAHAIANRELDASRAESSASAERQQTIQSALAAEKELLLETKASLAQAQSELRSSVELFEREKTALQSELSAERSSKTSAASDLEATRVAFHEKQDEVMSIRRALEHYIQDASDVLSGLSGSLPSLVECQALYDRDIMSKIPNMSESELSQSLGRMHQQACDNLRNVIEAFNNLCSDAEQLRISQIEQSEKNATLEQHMSALNLSLADVREDCSKLQASERSLKGIVEQSKTAICDLSSEKNTLLEDLKASRAEIENLRDEVDAISTALAEERSTRDALPSDEKKKLLDRLTRAAEVAESMWSLAQRICSEEIVQNIESHAEESSEDDSLSKLGPMALQGFRVLAAELGRLREVSVEYDEKLAAAQREIESIWDRTEIAESERDSARAARDRWERDASTAHERAFEEAAKQAQDQLSDLEQELMGARQDVSILQESLEKSEAESSGLRSLLSKLKSQFNSRTNELDEAEEKLAYLQDHVASLEEDLEMAQQKLQTGEQQSGAAYRVQLERMSSELEASQEHAAGLEEEVIKLREESETAKNSLREATLLAETHKTAEENLQIAIEQLEAEKDSMIERKTRELQKKLDESLVAAGAAKEKITEASVVMNKLALRDEEITELRTALGRLADERVELKLELEKSLSRLNHPDGGGQLVDRRVIRQLLVNYFRVGMARRRDVLELMSRMLGFSESDLVAVGLKRVALMERIGSLVQPPDLDGNSLPPIGTVSDKWIEFLMKETEEEEEDF